MATGLIPIAMNNNGAHDCAQINRGTGYVLTHRPTNEKPADALTPTGSDINLNGAAAPNSKGLTTPKLFNASGRVKWSF